MYKVIKSLSTFSKNKNITHKSVNTIIESLMAQKQNTQ